MEICKKIGKALLFPPLPVVILLVPIAAALLIYAFAVPDANEIVTYVSYGLSAYALTILCAKAPSIIRLVNRIRQENTYVVRYTSDVRLRANISLYSSILINAAYAVFQLCLGLYHRSVWFYAFAGYYFLLAVMRFFLAKETTRTKPGEDRFRELLLYRFCGMLLLPMNLTLGVIVFYIVWQGRTFTHHEITTIAMAAYTFTATTLAIINVVKYRKYQSPVLSASKAISLAAAAVSMLTLETAMLTTFGAEEDPMLRRYLTAATGAAVCVIVLVMAIGMIIRSTKEIKTLKRNRSHEQ